jgi:hypothetical protein
MNKDHFIKFAFITKNMQNIMHAISMIKDHFIKFAFITKNMQFKNVNIKL